ncbi:MAG: copper resistance protein B [Geminicoccaceae bacterium]|nr:copper resistance protein B [Geminicoccaceae bacterium]
MMARIPLIAALACLAATPALAQERAPVVDDIGRVPRSVDEVRDPEGPVTAEDLARGTIDVPGEPIHDNQFRVFGIADRLEYQSNEGDAKYLWDLFGYAGGDYNRLWIEAEGEGLFENEVDTAEFQVLYSRALTPYWNLQVGGRYDVRPDPSKWYGVFAFEGLNLYWSEIEADLYLSEDGDLSGSFEVEYDEFLTQRLVLQPRFEVNAQAQDVDDLGLGSGITDYELGLRLRYEIVREFAPYVGVSWTRQVGDTADRLPDDEDPGRLSFVAGVRVWF